MRKTLNLLTCLLAGVVLFAAWTPAAAQEAEEGYALSEDLEVRPLGEGLWLHTTWQTLPEWGRFPSHGLVVVSEGRALLVDTAWGEETTARLLAWIDTTLGVRLDRAVVTHAHDDRMGGIALLQARGVPVYAHTRTAAWAAEQGLVRPDSLFDDPALLPVGARKVEVFYPGAGHTRDNVVAWVGDAKVLFGGCLVRAANTNGLGNVADADVAAWPETIRRVRARYAEAERVVPSHGPVGGIDLLDHTLHVLEEAARRASGG